MATRELYLKPIANISNVVGRRYYRSANETFVQDIDGSWYTCDKKGEPTYRCSLRPLEPTLCAISVLP